MKLVMKTLWQFLMKKRNIENWTSNDEYSGWWIAIRMMNSQRSDVEKISLIEEDEKIGMNEVIKCNEIINNRLK